jgi:chitin synthase
MTTGMYLLLVIYSLCNVHLVSWGTRENKETKVEQKAEETRKQEEALEQAKKTKGT